MTNDQKIYYSVVQTLCLLADPQNLYCELGRGSGKTTHILAPRLDRVANSMQGSLLVFAAATYKSIFENLVPGIMEYFQSQYKQGLYFEIGKIPPKHFRKCSTFIDDYSHTITFQNGTVVQFVSAERPESMAGKSAQHLFIDEMLHIDEQRFVSYMMPALRGDKSKFGDSCYYAGITGTTSTPNLEIDNSWYLKYEQNMDIERVKLIQQLALKLNDELLRIRRAQVEMTDQQKYQRLVRAAASDEKLINYLRRGTTYYLRASSFSNIKILGIDYITNQLNNIKDYETLQSSIFAIRQNRVKDLFFGRFGKEYCYTDSYKVGNFENRSLLDAQTEPTADDLLHYDKNLPLYMGYDPGGFTSIVVAQRYLREKTMRVIKNFYKIYPEQHAELADDISKYFKNHRRRTIFLHYDRAANQRDPQWKKTMPTLGDINDSDAITLKRYLERQGWQVQLMSIGQPVIFYSQHLRLLTKLFGGKDKEAEQILIDANECEALVSSIYHSPLKRTDGKIELDKSSEKLPYERQAYESTQIASAFMYLLYGEYSRQLLPESDTKKRPLLAI